MSRRSFIRAAAGSAVAGGMASLLAAPTDGAAEKGKPNIILAMADDMGWGDPGFNGNKVIKTPNLDEMAKAGLRFERFYSGAPVCSPTRGSCLTGRHPYRYGIWTANAGHMRKEEITLAEALKTQGYATGHFGKWHLGTLNPEQSGKGARRNAARNYTTPGMNGSDEWFATEYGVRLWDPMKDNTVNPYYHNGQVETENTEGCDSRVLMDRAIPFIRKAVSEKTPFLAVIWFHAPHEPIEAGPEFRAMYSEYEEDLQHYYGVITALDVQMGRLRKELRDLDVAENTILWFCSDNGPEGDTGDKGRTRGSAGPFRGRKRSLFEGGVHVPGLLEWPARIQPGSVTSVSCSTLDYFPTTLDLLGFKMEGQPEPIDGVSLAPLFAGKMKERPVPIPFETLGGAGSKASRGSPRMALIDNRFKLLTDMEGKEGEDMLFDLLADPGETTDIAAQHPDVVKTMKADLAAFRESCKRSLAGKDYSTPFTPDKDDIHPSEQGAAMESSGADAETGESSDTGATDKRSKKSGDRGKDKPAKTSREGRVVFQNDDSGVVSLAAAAATTHGSLTYRADQDKIGQWQNEQDWLSWQFEIHQPGEFEIEASIGQTEDGSVYEISVGDQKLKGVVSASGDLKTPKAQTVGSLRLDKAGAYTLELKPVSKKGVVVITLWRVDLVPVKR
ncbi:MAG: sulfatase-like hydrolase/transferase [Candidatus Sumerlaeota bacterium]|nr:sulfatase-like hydrolase/transferase [Candidatus Sumerlaeota bacterium]